MEFVAIDFETANRNSDSACSIGLVTFKDGKIVDEYYKLIRPKNLYFHPDNIKVHGLTEEMLPMNLPFLKFGKKFYHAYKASK